MAYSNHLEQQKALAILKSGRNVFLTGSAGTGKTYVLNEYIKYLEEHSVWVSVTASTGIAATHVDGQTIHSWSGMGIHTSMSNEQIEKLAAKQHVKRAVKNSAVLIIDEISMLHRNQLDLVNTIVKSIRDSQEAFGGLQVIFCGDFFQLPPIGNEGEKSRDKFVFMGQAWQEAKPTICYLTEQYRQGNDGLKKVLNDIRFRTINNATTAILEEFGSKGKEDMLRLYTHNLDVDQFNQERLKQLKSSSRWFTAETFGIEKAVEQLTKSVLSPADLELKKGAKVMFVRNNNDKGYLNGSIGEVIDFDEDERWPVVELNNGSIVLAEQEEWKITVDGGKKAIASFKQVPLRLAWAITIHKSQGMTLDEAEIDLSKTFETGQGYVALSRLRSLEGLTLKGINAKAFEVDPLAFKADQRFQELSQWADEQLEYRLLTKEFTTFIDKVKGTANKRKGGKAKKEDTHAVTASLIKMGYSIKKIAQTRELTESTIEGHFLIIKAKYPDLNLSAYRPKEKIIKEVKAAVEAIKIADAGTNSPLSLKEIKSLVSPSITYSQIKLALCFTD